MESQKHLVISAIHINGKEHVVEEICQRPIWAVEASLLRNQTVAVHLPNSL